MFKISKRISKKNSKRKLRRSKSKLIIKGGSKRINITVRAIDDDTAIFQTTVNSMDTIKSLKKADGLVVGGALCKEITNSIKKRQNIVTNVTNIVKRLKNKIK